MAITRDLVVTVKDDTSKLSERIFIYEGDYGIDLYFTINAEYKYKKDINILRALDGATAKVTILKPNISLKHLFIGIVP